MVETKRALNGADGGNNSSTHTQDITGPQQQSHLSQINEKPSLAHILSQGLSAKKLHGYNQRGLSENQSNQMSMSNLIPGGFNS